MKCEICGKETPYFIESFEPGPKKQVTYRLCEYHMILVNCIIERMIGTTPKYFDEEGAEE